MAVPLLRFNQDDGSDYPDWEEKKIGNILRICHGKDYKQHSIGQYPVIGTGGIMTYIDHYNCDWACALIGRKGSIDKPQYWDKPFWAIDTIFYSKPEINENPKWQYYLFHTVNWNKVKTGHRPSLNAKDIEKVQVFVPCPEEQQKIAEFFSDLDTQINNYQQSLDNLELQKKELLRQIFSQKLRFTKDDGSDYPDWEEKTISDFADIQMCKRILKKQTSERGDIPFYKIGTLGGKPNAYIDRSLYEDYKSRYKYPKIGEVLMTCSGTIGKCILFDGHDSYYQDSNIVWLRNNDNAILNKFIYYCIAFYGCKASSTDGIIGRLYAKDLKNIKFNFPCPEEQQKIADFLSDFDERIELERQRLQTMQELKKGLLQQMFC